ncbi:MAG: SusC/RagA family TonB-linked outer membrane protein [Bacteroidales bacterium]|nr:SusC/RagA family TonB-linked outer membrane protein [Bacteroidales bacterium]
MSTRGGVNTGIKVSVDVAQASINDVMQTILKGTDIAYNVDGTYVILSKKAEQQQNARRVITGTVKDDSGEPVPGAAVMIVGTSRGVTTDLDGVFSIEIEPADRQIEISVLGYESLVAGIGASDRMELTVHEESTILDDVVVTALGIKREEKALSYNVQKVNSDVINAVKDANFVNSLSGKIAGLQINQSASGAGGSTRVIMRGVKSISGNNNALYVIDGIPMPDLRSSQAEGYFETPDGGDFEGIANLNPEDFESMSILTGATAAALYGSQGANGVILITTKKGQAGKLKVEFSNNTTFSDPFVTPRFQNTYGTDATSPSMSWGSKLETPSSYNPLDFFQTGYNVSNSISVTAGTERSQTYASASALNSRGIIGNNNYNRYNFSLRNTTQLIKDKLTLDVSASYMKQYKSNPTVQGLYHNPLIATYLFPRGDDITKYQIYERYDANAGYMKQFWSLEFINGVENPYWEINREMFENTAHRYTISGTLKWDITQWMYVTGRARLDNMSMNYTRKIYASSNTLFASEFGNYQDNKINHNNFYGDVLLTIDKKFFNNDFSLLFNLGASIMDDVNNASGFEGHLATTPNKFSVYNISMTHSQTSPMADRWHEQTQALYATLQLGYKGMLYLDVTARNEWPSMLAFTETPNMFYPSVGLSGVISSMTDLSKAGISFMKVRASYAEVGNAPQRFITGVNTPLTTGGIISSDTYAPAYNLTPERTKSVEVGLNMKFLNNMVWLDYTYYNTNTYNQLFKYDAAPSTGYKQAYINAGKVNNWGMEASLGFQNTWGDFYWSTGFTFSMNRNKIKELVPEGARDVSGNLVTVDEVNMDYGGYRMKIAQGGSIGDFYVTGLKTDDHGQIYVDPNSNTVTLDPNTWIYAGNTEARARLGWNNTFSFKGVSLSFLIDARIGGHGVSATQALMDRFGASQASADARDNGGVWISADQFLPDAKTFYANNGNGTSMLSHYVYSMTNVRLREVTIGYDLPRKWFKDKLGMTVSLVGRNLWMIYNKAPFDPELTASTGTYYQGLDYFMQPSTRNIGFSVRLQF